MSVTLATGCTLGFRLWNQSLSHYSVFLFLRSNGGINRIDTPNLDTPRTLPPTRPLNFLPSGRVLFYSVPTHVDNLPRTSRKRALSKRDRWHCHLLPSLHPSPDHPITAHRGLPRPAVAAPASTTDGVVAAFCALSLPPRTWTASGRIQCPRRPRLSVAGTDVVAGTSSRRAEAGAGAGWG